MFFKRIFDLLVSLVCIIIFMPVIVVVSLVVFITMGRPVFFVQERPGMNGRPFYLLKFRTMRSALQQEQGAEFDGARITLAGRILRSTSLDELPTLWNVIRGDMSLVGPRPLLMQYLHRYSTQQARRHEVRPGITGWAQVNGRNTISWEQKFDYDVWYVDNRSFLLDMKILFLTVARVLKREGISHGKEATMPEFMGTEEQRGRGTKAQRHKGTEAQNRGTEQEERVCARKDREL